MNIYTVYVETNNLLLDTIPSTHTKTRKALKAAGVLDYADINPNDYGDLPVEHSSIISFETVLNKFVICERIKDFIYKLGILPGDAAQKMIDFDPYIFINVLSIPKLYISIPETICFYNFINFGAQQVLNNQWQGRKSEKWARLKSVKIGIESLGTDMKVKIKLSTTNEKKWLSVDDKGAIYEDRKYMESFAHNEDYIDRDHLTVTGVEKICAIKYTRKLVSKISSGKIKETNVLFAALDDLCELLLDGPYRYKQFDSYFDLITYALIECNNQKLSLKNIMIQLFQYNINIIEKQILWCNINTINDEWDMQLLINIRRMPGATHSPILLSKPLTFEMLRALKNEEKYALIFNILCPQINALIGTKLCILLAAMDNRTLFSLFTNITKTY